MISVVVNAADGVPPPRGSLFRLIAKAVTGWSTPNLIMVDTGLVFKLPPEIGIEITGVNCVVLSHQFAADGRLSVLVFGTPSTNDTFAVAELVERKVAKVRFIMHSDGKRMIAGEGQPVASGNQS